ncbi:MAG: NTF2 fold immunity protein [Caldilineaceae bacterium]
MDKLLASDAERVLIRFISAMNDWERDCWVRFQAARTKSTDIRQEQKNDLERMNEIFSEFCTHESYLNGRTGEFRNPPEYDPTSEHIVKVESKINEQVIVYTEQMSGFKHKNRYTILLKNKKWLIDKKEWNRLDGTWEQAIL